MANRAVSTEFEPRSDSSPTTWIVVRRLGSDGSSSTPALPALPFAGERIIAWIAPDSSCSLSAPASPAGWLSVIATDRAAVESAAIRRATCERIVLLDGDRITDSPDFDLVQQMLGRHDWVTGRSLDPAGGIVARTIRRAVTFLSRHLLGTGVADGACAVEGMSRRAWRRVLARPTPGAETPATETGFERRLARAAWLRSDGIDPIDVPIRTGEPAMPERAEGRFGELHRAGRLMRFVWSHLAFPRHDREAEANPQQTAARLGSLGLSLAMLLGFALLILTGLNFPLVEPDETRNVQIAIEMAESGDFVLPTRHGDPYLDKPAMLFWSLATSFRSFGIAPWSARLPVALACFATVAAVLLIGSGRYGVVSARVGALLLTGCAGFLLVGRFVITDALLTCWITWAALSLHRGGAPGAWRTAWWLVAGIALGLGVLTKGPVAPVLVLPPFLLWSWLERSLGRRDLLRAAWIIVPMIAIPLPWFLSVAIREPGQLEHFFLKHNLQRFTQAFDHREAWWFYVPVVFAGMFPTSLLIPSAAIWLFSRRPSLRGLRTRNDGYLLLCGLWTIGFFSCSSSKLPTYILPALPPLSLLLGRFVVRVLLSRRAEAGRLVQGYHRHLARWLPWQIVTMLAVVAVAAAVVEAWLVPDIRPTDWWQWIGMAFAASLTFVVLRSTHGPFVAKWGLLGASLPIVLGYLSHDVYGDGTSLRSNFPEALAQVGTLEQNRPKNDPTPVVWFGRMGDSIRMHLGRTPDHRFAESQVTELCRFAAERGETIIVAIPRHAHLIADDMPMDFRLEPIRDDGLLWRLRRESSESGERVAGRPGESRTER